MAEDQKQEQKLVEAIVAPGRTVHAGKKPVGPGGKVFLPAETVAALRTDGFLVDPNAPKMVRDNGPTFGVKDGPSIKVAA